MCANNPMNIGVLHSELSPTLLTDYLARLIEKDIASGSAKSVTGSSNAVLRSAADAFDAVKDLKERIPRSLWPALIEQLQL